MTLSQYCSAMAAVPGAITRMMMIRSFLMLRPMETPPTGMAPTPQGEVRPVRACPADPPAAMATAEAPKYSSAWCWHWSSSSHCSSVCPDSSPIWCGTDSSASNLWCGPNSAWKSVYGWHTHCWWPWLVLSPHGWPFALARTPRMAPRFASMVMWWKSANRRAPRPHVAWPWWFRWLSAWFSAPSSTRTGARSCLCSTRRSSVPQTRSSDSTTASTCSCCLAWSSCSQPWPCCWA